MGNWSPERLNDFSELVSGREKARRIQVLLAPSLLLNSPKPLRNCFCFRLYCFVLSFSFLLFYLSSHVFSPPPTSTWDQHTNQRTWKFLEKLGYIMLWSSMVGVELYLSGRVYIYSCSLGRGWMWELYPSTDIFTAQWMYRALEHQETDLSSWLCHHPCGLEKLNCPLWASVPHL